MASRQNQQSTNSKSPFFYGYIVVAVSFCILIVVYGVYNAFGVFLKPVLTDFGWTRAMTSGAFSLAWIVHGLLGIAWGRMNDTFGPRWTMTIAGFLMGLGYLLMSQISHLWHFYLLYGVVIGAGVSGGFVPLTSTIARWFTRKRTMMTGIALAGTGMGGMIVPPVATLLILNYDWRVSYAVLGAVVLVFVMLLAQFLKRDPDRSGQMPYGEDIKAEHDVKSTPSTLREAVRVSYFWTMFVMFFALGYCTFSIMVHIVPHATDLGISEINAANVLATIGAIGVVGRIVLGVAADRIGNNNAFIVGFILMAVTLPWLVVSPDLWVFYLFAVIFGLASGGCIASESPLVAVVFGLDSHGLILGVLSSGFCLGAAAGPFVAGYLCDLTSNYQMALLASTGVAILGLVMGLILRLARKG